MVFGKLTQFLIKGGATAITAGILALIFGSVLGAVPQIAMLTGLIAVVLAFVMLTKSKVTRNAPEFLLLLATVAIIGEFVVGIVPAAGQFIFSTLNFTATGLAFTIFYVTAGLFVAKKIPGVS